MKLKPLIPLFVILLLVSTVSAKPRLTDIEVYPKEKLDLNDKFYVWVGLGGDTCGTVIKFFIDNEEFSSKSVGCDREEMESKKWDIKNNPLECGLHEVRAELIKAGEGIQNISMDIWVGDIPVISFSPDKPLVNRDIKIKLTDAETGDALSSVVLDIYLVKDGRTSAKEYSTDSNGELTFRTTDTGKYMLVLKESDYCGTQEFYVKKNLIVEGPKPENPTVGELISLAVPMGVGVKFVDSEGRVYPLRNVGGGVNFTIDKPGDYTLVIGELSSEYWSVNRSIVVSPKLTPSVTIKPENPSIGKDVIIAIGIDGNALNNAKVTITKPDGNSETYTSDSGGEVRFIPTSIGWYSIKVEKEQYESVDAVFQVKNSQAPLLSLKLSSEEIELGDSVTISAIDEKGNEIPAELAIKKPDGTRELISGNVYTPLDVGNYEISISKADVSITKTLTVKPHPLELKTEISNNKLMVKAISHGEPVQGIIVSIETPTEKRNFVTDSKGIATFDIKNTGTVKIIADNSQYETVQITREIVKSHNYTLLIGSILLIIIAAVVALFLLSKKKGDVRRKGLKEKKSLLEKGKASSLSRV